MNRPGKLAIFILSLCAGVLCEPPCAQSAEIVLEAEGGRASDGWKRVELPWASGGAYMACENPRSGAVIEWTVDLKEPATLLVSPAW